jgi:Ca2+-binding RTX toxin-like protein
MPTVTDYTALLSGDYWNGLDWTGSALPSSHPVFVTYSFPTISPDDHTSVEGLDRSTFQSFSNADRDTARQALDAWASISGLTFIEVQPGQGQINFAWYDFSSLPWAQFSGGFAFYPFGEWDGQSRPYFFGDDGSSGDVFLNLDYAVAGGADYGLLLHEIGHAIGLKHPDEILGNGHDEVLDSSLNNTTNTIMSYNNTTTTPGLGSLDIAAAQFIYGTNAQDGTQVSSWSWDSSSQTLTQTGFATADVLLGISVRDIINGLAGDDRIFSLDGNDSVNGGTGNDEIFGGSGDDVLTGGGGDDLLRGGEGKDKLNGGSGNDWLMGENGVDKLIGGGGNDILIGGSGNDRLTGNAGQDLFVLAQGQGKDTVTDFQDGQDLIGLSGGLTYGNLSITQVTSGTQIAINGTGEILAVLTGINISQIATDDFILW